MKSSIFTAAQIAAIVVVVNSKVDFPVIGEKTEEKLITPIIESVLSIIEQKVPENILSFIKDTLEGFDPSEADGIKELAFNFASRLNKEVNIPLVSEETEEKIFSVVVEIVFEALESKKSLDTVLSL